MSVQAQFYVVYFGESHRKGGIQEYVQLLAVGFDPDMAFDDAGSFVVMPWKRWNDQLPIIELDTFEHLSYLYPYGLVEKVEQTLLVADKSYNPKSIAQVKGWHLWSEQEILGSVMAYA